MGVIDISGLPEEIQRKIIEVLGRDTLPLKKETLQDILPELDLPKGKKEQIIKILSPENKREAFNHERLESIISKYKSKVQNPKVQVLRDELKKRKNEK